MSLYYRTSSQYSNQISIVDGKKAGTDINLYKLFVERCSRLLKLGGRCGLLMPTGIYSDLGSKGLREMLFSEMKVDVLFGLSNEKYIFEGVHHSFRLCILAFRKEGPTTSFTAAFRINPREAISAERLESFLGNGSEHIELSWELVKRLSPSSFSLAEFRSVSEIQTIEKIYRFPFLGEVTDGSWYVRLGSEFHMTNDSHLFRASSDAQRLPLYEGRTIHQFIVTWGRPKYWLDEVDARKALLGREPDTGQELDYQRYRLGFRDIARSTDERTMIVAMLPRRVFCNHKLPTAVVRAGDGRLDLRSSFFLCAVLNSFVVDYLLRQRVSTNLTFFIVYQLPIPRPHEESSVFRSIVNISARLSCVASEFADLWQDVMESPWSEKVAATNPAERARLRAELDGLVAHLYGLTEEEFAYILTTFPVVSQEIKDAALSAYQALTPRPGDPEILSLIEQGESAELEFKSTARWDLREGKKSPDLEAVIRLTVAGFLNSHGGTLLIGVGDDGSIVGLGPDYGTFKKQNRDGFELFLTELLLGALGKDLATSFRITFHEVDGKDVCRVTVAAGPRPVFLKEGNDEVFYLRAGNSTRRLSTREAVQYCKTHWQS